MRILRKSDGLALVMAIFVMALVLVFLGGNLVVNRVDLKISSNLKLANAALNVADAGLQHALTLLPWGYDFDGLINCGSADCPLVSDFSFPAGSGYTYSVTVSNDNDGGSITDDINSTIILTSESNGPGGTRKVLKAYINRSASAYVPPSALYINADSISPALGSLFFDDDDPITVTGNDTNANDLSLPLDDSAGPNPALNAVTTTSQAAADTLIDELNGYGGISLHEITGLGSEPSIGATADQINVRELADRFINDPGTVKHLNGYQTDDDLCTVLSPCYLGTSSSPQITYIKDTTGADVTLLEGDVRGYGVLVLEGRSTLGAGFKFNGLVIHIRSDPSHYLRFKELASVYGGVLMGAEDGNVKFSAKAFSKLHYSSQALSMVESNWGSLLSRSARLLAWQESY